MSLDSTISTPRIGDILDAFHREQRDLERQSRRMSGSPRVEADLASPIARSLHDQSAAIVNVADDSSVGWEAAGSELRGHPAFAEFIMRSEIIQRAFLKPAGYAGDMEVMLTLCAEQDIGAGVYERLVNRTYQQLPCSASVRKRVRGMELLLRELRPGSRVLCLACGPALEIQRLLADRPTGLKIDLLDHDPGTLEYTSDALPHPDVRHVQANAYDIVKGRTSFPVVASRDRMSAEASFDLETGAYDLVYAMGLYDYIPSFPLNPSRGATGLTKRLFDLLRPDGRLIVGNFLTPGGSNPFQRPRQFMLDGLADWPLIYRTLDDVLAFAAAIPVDHFRAALWDETLRTRAGPNSVIGFLEIHRIA